MVLYDFPPDDDYGRNKKVRNGDPDGPDRTGRDDLRALALGRTWPFVRSPSSDSISSTAVTTDLRITYTTCPLLRGFECEREWPPHKCT
jgi:hypothetical protein